MHFLITAISGLSMGILLLVKRNRNYLIYSLCAFFVGTTIWQVSLFLRHRPPLGGESFSANLTVVGFALTFFFALNLLALFLQGGTSQWHPLKWRGMCIVPAILLLLLPSDILSLRAEDGFGLFSAQQIVHLATLLYYIYALCIMVVVNYKLNRNPPDQPFLFLGLIGLLFFAPALRVVDSASSPYSGIASLIAPEFSTFSAYILLFFGCVLAYDAMRYGGSGIRPSLGKQFGYLYIMTLYNGIYLLFVLGLAVVCGRLLGFSLLSFWGAITFLTVVLITNPLKSIIQRWLQRRFHRTQGNLERLLFEIGQQVISIFDLKVLGEFLVQRVADVLNLKRCCLVLISDTLIGQQVVSDTERKDNVPSLYEDGKLMRYLHYNQSVQLRTVVQKEETFQLEQSAAAVLLDVGFCVCISLVSEGKLWGCLLLSAKRSGEDFLKDELAMLSTMAAQVATAITNTRLHQELLHAERLATIGRFSAEMAHEVRNPLLSIKGAAQVIAQKIPSEHIGQEFASMIIEESNRLNRVITEFLNYSRGPEPLTQPCDIRECIEMSLSTLKTESFTSLEDGFQQKQILVEKRYTVDIPLIPLDMELMEQVFLNLFKNAFDAIKEGGKLIITVRKADWIEASPGLSKLGGIVGFEAQNLGVLNTLNPSSNFQSDVLEVEIKDTGCGIASQHLPHLFEPFYTTKEGGTGLGLSIARNIIQAHGGAIQLESVEGEGTTVRILFAYNEEMGKSQSETKDWKTKD
jgi:signal transduction histidine kinase